MSFKLRYNYFIMLSEMFLKCYIATIFFGFWFSLFKDLGDDGRCNLKNKSVKEGKNESDGCFGLLALFLIPLIICTILDVLVQPLVDSLVYYFSPQRDFYY